MSKNIIIRYCLFLMGIACLGLGILGVFLPLLPTTPFVLFSAWCFTKSSQSMHDWIYRQPLFMKIIQNWENNKAIDLQTKLVALAMLASSVAMIWWRLGKDYLSISVVATLFITGLSLFLITRPQP